MSAKRFPKAVLGVVTVALLVAAAAAAAGPTLPPTVPPTFPPTIDRTPMALRVLDDGRIMIAGSSGSGFFITAYSPAGAVVSNVNIVLPFAPEKMAISGAGMVAVAATIANNKGDIWVQKYMGSSGFPWWWHPAIYSGSGNGPDQPSNLGFDSVGNVFVSGQTMNSDGKYDFVTLKLDTTTGGRHWAQVEATGANGDDVPVAMTLNSDQDVQIAGKMWDGTDYNYGVVCYAGTTGLKEWPTAIFDSGENTLDVPTAMSVDKWDHLTVSGYIPNGGMSSFATLQWDCKTGALRWGPVLLTGVRNSMPTATAIDGKGNVFVTGVSEDKFGRDNFVTVKYHLQTGNEEWRAGYTAFNQFGSYPIGMAVDANNDVVMTGVVTTNHFYDTDFVTVKYNGKTGAVKWGPVLFDFKNHSEDVPVAVAVDAAGNFYVTGATGTPLGNRPVTVKYDGLTGHILWIR